ncbi:MAG TPA: circadian clock protein KaiC [Tepidisphaeraceae bacterium]
MASRNIGLAERKLKKAPTGISGFDDITHGGVPQGRPTLICGSAGCGKSLFGVEFLVHGATRYHEPGVLMTFEEGAEDIKKNVASLGFDLDQLIRQKKLIIDYVHVDRSEIEENGEYDLEGLFIRLGYAIDKIGAKRVVLDTIETLFSGLNNQAVLRAELRRLFGWLKDRGLTTIITGEKGDGTLTRQGLEEYVSDCVVLLDHRVTGQVSTRRMRVVKYRGTTHGTNEYPFLIDEKGVTVLPITSSGMDYEVSNQRVSTGIKELDEMLGGKGLYRGSTVLLSGSAGTGKTSISAHMADANSRRGERTIYFSFEESPAQIMRNMKSVGINLEPHVKKGLLTFHSTRPTVFGLEMHLVRMHKLIEETKPSLVIIDPISNLYTAGSISDSTNVLVRLIDSLRKNHVTCVMVSLTSTSKSQETTDEGMSSMVDTWLLLRDIELAGERNRGLYVLKSRGMAHSNQIREFLISKQGVKLIPVYLGQAGVLTGSARMAQENKEKAEEQLRRDDLARKSMALEHRRRAIEAQIAAIQADFKREEQEFARNTDVFDAREKQITTDRSDMSSSRKN